MRTLNEIPALREALDDFRRQGQRIALVATMGNLHQGHIALVETARRQADIVVATIFVNPMQFGPNEDLDAYPRTLADDQAKLTAAGCDLLFTPTTETVYPRGLASQTRIRVPEVSEGLCGGSRPGHFDGVATVVSMLFNLVQPDVACFGQKDYQQLAVIRRMVQDLHFPIEIIGVPTVRASDGLALSSRNGYLDDEQRATAPRLHQMLEALRDAMEDGEPPERALSMGREALAQAGFTPDYLELRATDLSPVTATTRDAVLLAAARLGPTRLIDNISLTLPR
ncbi:pantoate--beta-alanine ligase [Halomonas urumqiensis]|uniref:Pantothenate synthetase n=1 Tax=Halomonas urumqiensis TaxID=1684789 RepID=A0A2N7UL26_9GAMM|nr:pantoate--beta-alanine ligase [Halomonas urumqiensis]PMR81151.1 pantoate--beta-alanine ligase [Halomonas urumqiensis]PTB02477.1 pantoate--beta-alanine ligase [Halomonas urumqiensis]GHE20946.1 pantothenate synthetase [Halomonas urumqiensis]